MKVARNGFAAAITPETLQDFNLDAPLSSDLFQKQKREIDIGHCHTLPASAFKGMVNALSSAERARTQVIASTEAELDSVGGSKTAVFDQTIRIEPFEPRWPLKVLHLWPVKLLHPGPRKLMC